MEQAMMRWTLLRGNCWVGLDTEHPAWRLNPPVAFRVLWYVGFWSRRAGHETLLFTKSKQMFYSLKDEMEAPPSWKKTVETESALKCVDLGNVDSRHIDLVTMLWDKLDKQRMWARINNGHKSLLYLLVNEINLRINQRLNAYHRH